MFACAHVTRSVQALPAVMENALTATGPPLTIDKVFKFKSLPLVPQFPSTMWVAPEVVMRNHAAVPVAFADESVVIALRVSTPPDAPGANVALHVNCASRVVAVPPVAGRVPS